MTVHNLSRFFSHVEIPDADGCWLWTGAKNGNGYGCFGSPLAHRVIYEQLVAPIPAGLTIDHLCRVRNCVRPDHMEVVTQRVNSLRSGGASAVNAAKTHCLRGHPYLASTTYRWKGARYCRQCRAAAARAFRARRRESMTNPPGRGLGLAPIGWYSGGCE